MQLRKKEYARKALLMVIALMQQQGASDEAITQKINGYTF